MTRRSLVTTAVLVAVAVVVGLRLWSGGGPSGHAELPSGRVAAAAGDRLIAEPEAGMTPIDRLLASARRSLDLTIYELSDPTVEEILATDAARGVRVRVLLDQRYERRHNTPAAAFLRAHGVDVRWASTRFACTHEKTFVIDDTTAVVMSLNLASSYYPTTRDAAVVDTDAADVTAIDQVFTADFAGHPIRAPDGDDLVWSPDRSQADVLSLIRSARRSVLVESEELSAAPVVSALVTAARRGVAVGLVMTDKSEWHPGFNAITAAGGRVRVLHGETPLYIHAKLLVVDAGQPDARALVGSQNLSTASLDYDRELGVVLTEPRLVSALARLIESDAGHGSLWR